MSKLLAVVFIGVFTGALIYEIAGRKRPELVEKIRDRAARKIDKYLEAAGERKG